MKNLVNQKVVSYLQCVLLNGENKASTVVRHGNKANMIINIYVTDEMFGGTGPLAPMSVFRYVVDKLKIFVQI